MNKANILAVAALVVAVSGALFAAGNAVHLRDQKLLAADDRNRATLVSRSCGKSGRLLQDPFTYAYLCVWTNPDGTTLTTEVPQYPYLDQLAAK